MTNDPHDSALSSPFDRRQLFETLERWNPWGAARLDPGFPRRVLDNLRPFLDTPEIVALIGPRRAGKTTVLYQVMRLLEEKGTPLEALFHLNLEEPALTAEPGIELLERLYRLYRAEVFPQGRAWIFLDEIQHVPGWERWVRARNESEDVKFFVTGSSAALMSAELATLLTGRHVTFRVMPLDFRELLQFRGVELPRRAHLRTAPPEIQHALYEYLRWGGFPEVVLAKDEERKEVLLKQYFDDILFRDVSWRHQIRNFTTLRRLAVHLLSRTARLVSLQRLAQIFGVSLELIRSYCQYLEEAFLVHFVPFYSLKTGEEVRRPRKVHALDPGLRNAVCLTGSPDRGYLAESVVHNALLAQAPDSLFYWEGTGEVDLLVHQGTSVRTLVQVCESLDDRAVRDRELRALAAAKASFPTAQALLVASEPPAHELRGTAADVDVVPLWRFLAAGGASIPERKDGPEPDLPDPESAVLEHLNEHGRMTRKEVCALLGLTAAQASSLLRRLLAEGELVRHGSGRGTWYGLRGRRRS
jgi:hypothetical protein